MSFLKKLSFGKKKNVTEQKNAIANDDLATDFGDDGSIEINESVVESLSMEHDHAENGGHHKDSQSINESIGGGSADTSPESIFEAAQGDHDYANEPPENGGLGSKIKSLFGSKNKESNDGGETSDQTDAEQFSSAEGVEDRMSEITASIGKKPKALPLIGKLAPKTQSRFALTVMVLSLGAAGYLSITSLLQQAQLKERANIGTQTQLASQNILLTAQNLVSRADAAAVGTLGADRKILEETGKTLGLDQKSEYATSAVKTINEDILPVIDRALKIGAELGTLPRQLGSLERNTANMYLLSDQLASYLEATSTSSLTIAAASDMRVRAERLSRNGLRLLTANTLSLEPLAEFSTDLNEINKMFAILSDPGYGLDANAAKFVEEIKASSVTVNAINIFMLKNANLIVNARLDVVRMRDAIGAVTLAASNYTASVNSDAEALSNQIFISLMLLAAGVAAMILLALVNNRLTRIEAWDTAYKNKSNEKDIIEFMGEIMPLEMGDLTANFTGTLGAMEGITGGIRSSVNEAVTSLRDAMSTVKNTTGSVMTNVSESVGSSRDLQNSNDRQSKEIEGVVGRVVTLAAAIQAVTDNTALAAEMATSAKSASDTGARVVAQTNEKMAEIRNSMQDVLKSVKHLGETSHEIGTIVEAIETITDRTQVIAVNASLEAAKAGAAGQGFQVLAGEVNRLAEQSNEALRTITALVQRIQGETAATIRVVEDSTNNVVEGAKLSEAANSELAKISVLSEQLQDVMTKIRSQSESQSTNAGEVRESMDRLNALSGEFQTTVSQMVAGVQQIDASMGTLQSTVSIFTTEKSQEDQFVQEA